MANNENLKPLNTRTEEEKKKIQSMGGVASGKAKRRKKLLKERLELLLEKDYETNFEITENIFGETMSGEDAICVGLIQKAVKGDARAFITIRDTLGEKPVNKIAVNEVDKEIVAQVEEMIEEDNLEYQEKEELLARIEELEEKLAKANNNE